jgi:hypothetical protein
METKAHDRTDGKTNCADTNGQCRALAAQYDCNATKFRTLKGVKLLKDLCCNSCESGKDKPVPPSVRDSCADKYPGSCPAYVKNYDCEETVVNG